jgi:hypothetical protein
MWRKTIDRATHGAALGVRGAFIERIAEVGELDNLRQRLLLAEHFEALGLWLARGLAARIDEQVAADLAQPREQRRAAAKSPQAAHGVDHGHLHDIFDGGVIERTAARRECTEACRVGLEELVEGSLIATAHPVDEFLLVQHAATSLAPAAHAAGGAGVRA